MEQLSDVHAARAAHHHRAAARRSFDQMVVS
ncbi:hypothetical protein SMF913_25580 [Streptomyces malaysiensis]|uniref:Uncharacterized protein n=1 Tax=Streptomyces malaysiensis TaxID=92644 RepID=A0A2J7YPZ7_STRMQ|nr:hypothetical protein SMF913_25580 [Streptomyces malaysiensis]